MFEGFMIFLNVWGLIFASAFFGGITYCGAKDFKDKGASKFFYDGIFIFLFPLIFISGLVFVFCIFNLIELIG